MLEEIQALQFAIVDLHLYLDTHPCDCKIIEHHNCLVNKLEEARKCYEEIYGPLVPGVSKCPWQWIEEPWPWEINY